MSGKDGPIIQDDASNGRGEWTSKTITKLGWRQFIQQLIGAVLDQVSILRRESMLAFQQGIKSFAGSNEIRNFFSNKRHEWDSLRTWRHGVREEHSLTGPDRNISAPVARRCGQRRWTPALVHSFAQKSVMRWGSFRRSGLLKGH